MKKTITIAAAEIKKIEGQQPTIGLPLHSEQHTVGATE
jgi:hypothetical protein